MTEAAKTLLSLFRLASANSLYWLLALAALAFLFTEGRIVRRHVVCAVLFFVLLAFNPLTYAVVWDRLSYANWRLFWMVPVEGVICFAAVRLLGHIRHTAGRIVCGMMVIAAVILCGHNVYTTPGAGFGASSNAYKLPEEAVAAAQILLQQDPAPRAVVSDGLNCYLRQFSTDIQQMYGRDAQGYIHGIEEERRRVYELLCEERPDFDAVRTAMEEMAYDYLILVNVSGDTEERLTHSGFQRIGEAGYFAIYRIVS